LNIVCVGARALGCVTIIVAQAFIVVGTTKFKCFIHVLTVVFLAPVKRLVEDGRNQNNCLVHWRIKPEEE